MSEFSKIMTVKIQAFDDKSSYFRDAVDVYCSVWQRNYDDSAVFFKRYTQIADFIGYVAIVDNKVVGIAFGTVSQNGQWWHDKVAEQVGKKHPALQNTWVLTELAVLNRYRKHHIGSTLHDRVLAEQPYPHAILSTQVDNLNARRFYEKRQWQYLHHGFAFQSGRQPYCIMHKVTADDD
ncbi:MAG: GNAT family N-acetyltransferase [Phototrophicaceae bacterium]